MGSTAGWQRSIALLFGEASKGGGMPFKLSHRCPSKSARWSLQLSPNGAMFVGLWSGNLTGDDFTSLPTGQPG